MTSVSIAQDVASKIDIHEAKFAVDNYVGSGPIDNAIYIEIFGDTPIIFSAPHATVQQRLNPKTNERERKAEDQGTGGLAAYLADHCGATVIASWGPQTMDPNDDLVHPNKQEYLQKLVVTGNYTTLIDIHGMGRSHGLQVALAMGARPRMEEGWMAEVVLARCRKLGWRLWINYPKFTGSSPQRVGTFAQTLGLTAVTFELAPYLRFGDDIEKRLAAAELILDSAMQGHQKRPIFEGLRRDLAFAGPLGRIKKLSDAIRDDKAAFAELDTLGAEAEQRMLREHFAGRPPDQDGDQTI